MAVLIFILDCLSTVAVFIAIVRVVTVPADRWRHRRLSKTVWIIAAVWFTIKLHGLVFPVGAALAIWYAGRVAHQTNQPSPPELPFAEGTPEIVDTTEGK